MKLEKHFEETKESELAMFAQEIINFADDLKNGVKKSSASFQHISSFYDKYRKLGGNSYVEAIHEYIIEERAKQAKEQD